MAHEFGEVPFGLQELLFMRYSIGSGAYTGTVVNMDSDQLFSVEPQSDNDEMRDSGAITRALSVFTKMNWTIGMGGWDVDALAIVTGSSSSSSGSTPNRVRTTKHFAGGAGLPYFGMIAAAPTDDGGVFVLGLKICKANAKPAAEWDGKENKFHVSEVEGVAIADAANSNIIFVDKQYETAADWTAAKPTNAATFLAFFA